MACGVGACYGCVCSSADRKLHYRICKEGPVFNWEEVASMSNPNLAVELAGLKLKIR